MQSRSGRTAWRQAVAAIAPFVASLGACAVLTAQAPTAPQPPSQSPPPSPAPAAPPVDAPPSGAPEQPPAAPATATAGQAAPATPPADVPTIPSALTFTTPAATLLAAIKPDKTVDYEWLLAAFVEALKTSADPSLQQVAANLKVYKATEPAPGGSNVLYLLLIDPVVPEADYSWQELLNRIYAKFPEQAQGVFEKGTSVHAGPMNKLSLTPVTPSMTPPSEPAGAPPPAAVPQKPPAD